jgi:hypothetical protein
MARTFWGVLADLERQEEQQSAGDPDRAERYVRHMDGDCREDCFCRLLAENAPAGEAAYRESLAGRAGFWRDWPPRPGLS